VNVRTLSVARTLAAIVVEEPSSSRSSADGNLLARPIREHEKRITDHHARDRFGDAT